MALLFNAKIYSFLTFLIGFFCKIAEVFTTAPSIVNTWEIYLCLLLLLLLMCAFYEAEFIVNFVYNFHMQFLK